MKYVKFFFGQLLVFAIIMPIFFVFDSLIGPPFTRLDLLVGALSVPFQYLTWKAWEKLGAHFKEIRLPARILLSIPAFILPVLLVGYLGYAFFQGK